MKFEEDLKKITFDNHVNDNEVEDLSINKEVDEVVQAVEEVHVVGYNESSTDENFGLGEHDNQHDESEEGYEYESVQEDDASMDDSAEDPTEYTQRPRMLRELDSDLD